MSLIRTEYNRLLALIDLSHHELDTLALSYLDLNPTRMIEVFFFIDFSCFDLSLDHFIISNELIIIKRSLNSFHLERCEKSIIDAIFE